MGKELISQLVVFFLEYNVMIIAALLIGFFLLQFIEEYFPRKPRAYDLGPALFELNLRRKYLCKTSKYLENLNLPTHL